MFDPENSALLNNNHTGSQFTLPKKIPRLDRSKLRPRLPNLRSPWTTQQTIEESEDSDEQPIKIELPPIKLESVVLKGLATELGLLASLASLLCLSSASLLVYQHPIIYSGFLGAWFLLPTWIIFGRSEHCTKLFHSIVKWSRFGALIMLILSCFHLYSHSHHYHGNSNANNNSNNNNYLPVILTSLAICVFHLTNRLFQFQFQLSSQVYQLVENEQKCAQTQVNESLQHYFNRRAVFLSTISQEIRDAALMVIATLEQFSPSSILSNTHELLSACSIAVPIASISAINTTIVQACHISSHLSLVSKMLKESDTHTTVPKEKRIKSTVKEEFDIGELVQNVGDALAGISAKLGVHFVIYHADNELHYTNVIGDENAIKHALINLLRNILEGCTPGACIEFGLSVLPIPDSPQIKVVFDIIQMASPAIPSGLSTSSIPNANFTMQLLNYIGGEMELEDMGHNKTRVKVSMNMLQGSSGDQKLLLIEKPSQILEKTLSTVQFSNEPTLEELTRFIASLKGVKMILHGPEKSVFAKHLTSCLTSWNTDISHVPVLGFSLEDDDSTGQGNTTASSSINTAGSDSDASISTPTSSQSQSAAVANSPMVSENSGLLSALPSRNQNKVPSPAIEEEHIHSIPPAFILIDDDIVTLEKKLRKFRDHPVALPPTTVQKRHRRSKSQQSGGAHSGTVAIVFFASLSSFKRVRDTIHWFGTGPQLPFMPRVIVVPKPAGPRRFLTALHTAWVNAIVEPQFIPIATSPLSPFMSKPVNSPNISGSPHLGDLSSLDGMMTPGGMVTAPVNGAGGSGNSGVTPHDITRFSPGRRTAGGPPTNSVRTNPLHSPSASQADAERGNYFFDPVNRPISNTAASSVLTGTGTPIRRKRSQSTTRRTLIDISINGKPDPESPLKSVPVTEPTQAEDNGVQSNVIPDNSEHVMPAANVENTKKEEPEKPKTRFNFKISNRKKKDKTQSDKQSPPITVLIVEDNMINQAILSTWMKKHKIKFSVASDGEEAVEKWKGGGFHLILMDIQLPTMDGIQATKMIRDIEKQNKIGVLPDNNNEQKLVEEESTFKSPVIIVALTASSLESDRQAALAAGCNDFLTKPVSLEWLEKKIMEWGCMQALIDVEGWRRWRQSTDSSNTTKDSLKAKKLKAPALLKKATMDENERAILEQRTKDLLKDESKAIVLVGMNKRRMSTFEPENHKLTKKNSDPDLNSLSIPKQLAARKRLEDEQS